MHSSVSPPPPSQAPDAVPPRTAGKGLWVVSGVCLALFVALALWVWLDGAPRYFDWDLAVSVSVQALDAPWLLDLMGGVSLLGDGALVPALTVAAACAVLLALRAWRAAVVLVLLVAAGQAVKTSVKIVVDRPRPTATSKEVRSWRSARETQSFPSGHTTHYVVLFGFLFYLTWAQVRVAALRWPLLILFGGLVLLVGLSRVYLGAHWVSDVLGGYLLGGGLLAAGIACYREWTVRAARGA